MSLAHAPAPAPAASGAGGSQPASQQQQPPRLSPAPLLHASREPTNATIGSQDLSALFLAKAGNDELQDFFDEILLPTQAEDLA